MVVRVRWSLVRSFSSSSFTLGTSVFEDLFSENFLEGFGGTEGAMMVFGVLFRVGEEFDDGVVDVVEVEEDWVVFAVADGRGVVLMVGVVVIVVVGAVVVVVVAFGVIVFDAGVVFVTVLALSSSSYSSSSYSSSADVTKAAGSGVGAGSEEPEVGRSWATSTETSLPSLNLKLKLCRPF